MTTLTTDQLALVRVALEDEKKSMAGSEYEAQYAELLTIFDFGSETTVKTSEEVVMDMCSEMPLPVYDTAETEALEEMYNRG
jgi:hypothetical protein